MADTIAASVEAALEPLIPERTMFQAVEELLCEPLQHLLTRLFQGNGKYYVGALVIATAAIKTWTHMIKQNRRKKWDSFGKDVVVLHAFKRCRSTPCLSPFVLKLETYLRMADIPYKVDMTEPIGAKGKCPWITLNGEDYTDSQLIVEALGKKFNKNFSSHLTLEEIGVAQSMRVMTEEHFFCCLQMWLFFEDHFVSFRRVFNFPPVSNIFFSLMIPFFKRRLWKTLYAAGAARHTFKEVEDMGKKDLIALSSWLGDKDFFMGDKPTEVDCAIFGFLAQLVWHIPHSHYGILVHECNNLISYCFRMKDKFWPDWNANLDPPKTD